MKTLVIVESPKKAKTIGEMLGGAYDVEASFGHIRDLPTGEMEPGEVVTGVGALLDPRYEVPERQRAHVQRLRTKVRNAERVLLATDPDREGEAIAWHLERELGLRNASRVTFHEITATAIRNALASERRIDMALVGAQEARRVLDRLVGYAVSPLLSSQAGQALSAGRVQSPTLRLVVDREREIRQFKSRSHFGAELGMAGGWSAQWLVEPHLRDGENYWTDQARADLVAALRNVLVEDYSEGLAKEAPAAPFTTSTLQQAASKRLNLKPKLTMIAAQGLKDRGHITYHRTDNPNLSAEGHQQIVAFAEAANLDVVDKARRWKAKAGAQEAHEAIRPTNMHLLEVGDNEDERALYSLIWTRALASVLADAEYATRRAVLVSVDGMALGGVPVRFEARSRVLTRDGWRAAYTDDLREEEEDNDTAALSNPIPKLEIGMALKAQSGRRLDKATRAPARYTEGSLVKALEDLGIGRPATYAEILENISDRSYVRPEREGSRFLVPTPTGEAIVDALVGKCRFVELDFTADLEAELDDVAAGTRPWKDVVSRAWQLLSLELDGLTLSIEPEHSCPQCGRALRRRKGANGFFWGCTGFPDCKVTAPDKRGKPGEVKPPAKPSQFNCPKEGCGKPLVRRQGKTKAKKGQKSKAYDFYGCSGYPSCEASYRTKPDGAPDLAI